MSGDVSLSAEDKPPKFGRPPLPPQAMHDQHEQEEHHHWLEGHTSLRYLLAGGIAGIGESSRIPGFLFLRIVPLDSVAYLHCSVRPRQDLSDHSSTRRRQCTRREIQGWHQSYHGSRRTDIRRGGLAGILGRERTQRCQDLSGVCYQILLVRVLRRSNSFHPIQYPIHCSSQ